MKEHLTMKERIRAIRFGQIFWPLVILFVVIGIGVGIVNYTKSVNDNKVPTVELTDTTDNTTVTDSEYTLSGKTDKNNTITINDQKVEIGEDGSFSANLKLAEGVNTITIAVTGQNGKSAVRTITITREVPIPIPTSSENQAVSGTLSSSGPENFWIPEAALVSAVAVGWLMTKRELARAQKKI